MLPLYQAMQVCSEQLGGRFSVRIFESISGIDESQWDAISDVVPFYQRYQFLRVTEAIHSTIQFRYVLLYEGEIIISALYVQLLDFSFKNLVSYTAESSAGIKSAFKRFISKKDIKLLNLGNVFFTGDKGVICKNEQLIIPFIPAVFRLIHQSFSGKKPGAFLVANIYLQDEDKCIDFYNNAFHPFNTEPDMFMAIDEHWKSFDGYMNALSSKYRVRAKKGLSVSSEITCRPLSAGDIVVNKTAMQSLYDNVLNHVAFNMATLNVDFFEQMKLMYQDDCTVLGYFHKEELVAFACLFHVDADTLHVHYIGLNYEINKTAKLYNRMLLDFVKFAIEQEKKTIHFGRTATEIKTTIGAIPKPLHAYLKMTNGFVNASLPYFLKRIKPAEYTVRNPFKEELAI